MIRTLAWKELRTLGWSGLGMTAGFALLMAMRLAPGRGEESWAWLFDLHRALWLPCIAAAAWLGHALVSREHARGTQHFVASLPVPPMLVAIVKVAVGLILLEGLVVTATLVCLWSSRFAVALDGPLAFIVLVRTCTFAAFVWSVFFVFSFLGRYRIPLFLLTFLCLAMVIEVAGLDVSEIEPLAVVDRTLASHRDGVPWGDVVPTGLAALALVLVGTLLANVREGMVASSLARRMSHREKVYVAVLLIATVTVFAQVDPKPEPEPLRLHGGQVRERDGVRVVVLPGARLQRDVALARATELHAMLLAMSQHLTVPPPPPVFVTTRLDVDVDVFERGDVRGRDGVLVRVHPDALATDEGRFRTWLVSELLDDAAHGRLSMEARSWLLDGFATEWGHLEADSAPLVLRAAHVADRFDASTPGRWLSFRREVGEDIASAIAWVGLRVMEREAGEQQTRDFLRAVLGRDVPEDARATWRDWRQPMDELMELHLGRGLAAHVEAWDAELDVLAARHREALAAVHPVEGMVDVESPASSTRLVTLTLAGGAGLPSDARVKLRYTELRGLNVTWRATKVRTESVPVAAALAGVTLPDAYPRHRRLAWSVAVHDPVLGCEVTSGWREVELR